MILTIKGIPEDLKTVFIPAVELLVVSLIWKENTQKKLITNVSLFHIFNVLFYQTTNIWFSHVIKYDI